MNLYNVDLESPQISQTVGNLRSFVEAMYRTSRHAMTWQIVRPKFGKGKLKQSLKITEICGICLVRWDAVGTLHNIAFQPTWPPSRAPCQPL